MNGLRWFLLVACLLKSAAAFSVEAVVSYQIHHKPYAAGKDSTFLEVYWDINPSSLHYRKDLNGNLISKVQVAVSISGESGVLLRDRYTLQTKPARPGEAAQQKLFQFRRYLLPQDARSFRLDLGEEEFLAQSFQYNQNFERQDTGSTPHFGRLQLLDTFVAGIVIPELAKDGFTQSPRVLNFYDEGQSLLHFYAPFYNPRQQPDTLVWHFYIAKGPMAGAILRLQHSDTVSTAARSGSARHTFDLATLASGNYYLNAELINSKRIRIDTQSLFFQVINKQPQQVVRTEQDSLNEAKQETTFLDLGNTFVSKFTTKQILAILKMISPVADPVEAGAINNFLKRPDDTYMRYFVYNFFSKENKQHPEAAWKQFANLIREVNRDFNMGSKMGYETDRGRVYLQYGKPDERIRVPNESGALPYEVWRYNAVGRTDQPGSFLFYQPGFSMSDYILLTATVTGELYNPNWRSMLYRSGNTNGTSQAEQYIGTR